MTPKIILTASAAMLFAGTAHADSQSSNTSSNSSSNNGVTRERVVDTYCENGWCERRVYRRVSRDRRAEWNRRERELQRRYRERSWRDGDDD